MRRSRSRNTSGAPSLSVHIALREAGLSFDLASVEQPDGARKRERDYWSINPEGYLPPPLLDAAQHLVRSGRRRAQRGVPKRIE